MNIFRKRTIKRKVLKAKKILSKRKVIEERITPPFFEAVPAYINALNDKYIKYLLFEGGRGSGKSMGMSCFLIEESFDQQYAQSTFLCGREIQASIEQSVYKVIESLITQAHLREFFRFTKTQIRNLVTGVTFIFKGFRTTGGATAFSQLNKIKGMSNLKYVFVDESQDLTEETINVLFPTANRRSSVLVIKKPWHPERDESIVEADTRFLFAMNRNFDDDPIVNKLQTYIDDAEINSKKSIAKVVHMNIFDLPPEFQDPQLLEQARAEKGEIYYDHVWLGQPFHKLSGKPWRKVGQIPDIANIQTIAFLDPSFAGEDYTALSFLGMGSDGRLKSWGKVWSVSWDVAMPDIVEELKKWSPSYFYYEANALHSAPQKLFAAQGVQAIPHLSLTNKHERIYRVASVVSSVMDIVTTRCNREYIQNVLKYTDKAANDDAPDSLASACIKAGVLPDKLAA